ncbi:large subunit ribosomal protein L21 [Humidesulfovibrio mexicanus]|jgi:large subunit ribosomal protein L21|uniref:Large ribosomal subunit protein bL21 n=1 Tax=Humidesulfovibrio mexicanus TaxID=147047 RepID=A0A238Y8B0_9BACT|nr:50S ribosomal protein L21 [Humidesulfovibrio mexicanus]SNR67250.1 large subunit ribosomal protein L21 [Humidesulfovibrio mexicanus]
MFAIIETGGKQYRVEQGLEFKVELLQADPGAEVNLDKVLLVSDGGQAKIGAPYVEGATVACEVLGHGRGEKIIIFKKKRRNDFHKKTGHRQDYTSLKVKAIQA